MRGVFAAVVTSAALLMGAPSLRAAAPVPATSTQAEIDELLLNLAQSGCRFRRNGEWHDAAAARTHLQRKFDYLKKRDRIASTEDFIADAATASSLSGRAYAVQCGDAPEIPSAQWLMEQLKKIRSAR